MPTNFSLHLNQIQKESILGAIKYPLDDIVQTYIDDPAKAQAVLVSIFNAYFSHSKVADSVDFIRKIYHHDYPQNAADSYPYVGQEAGYSMVKRDGAHVKKINTDKGVIVSIELHNGRVIPKSSLISLSNLQNPDYFIYKERTGLLSLTSREDDVTPPINDKRHVQQFISHYIQEQIQYFKNMSNDLITLIRDKKELVVDLMQSCDAATLSKLSSMKPEGLELILLYPVEVMTRLINKVHFTFDDFFLLAPQAHSFLMRHSQTMVKIVEELHISWQELFSMHPGKKDVIIQNVNELAKMIHDKKITSEEILNLSVNSLTSELLATKPAKAEKKSAPLVSELNTSAPITSVDIRDFPPLQYFYWPTNPRPLQISSPFPGNFASWENHNLNTLVRYCEELFNRTQTQLIRELSDEEMPDIELEEVVEPDTRISLSPQVTNTPSTLFSRNHSHREALSLLDEEERQSYNP